MASAPPLVSTNRLGSTPFYFSMESSTSHLRTINDRVRPLEELVRHAVAEWDARDEWASHLAALGWRGTPEVLEALELEVDARRRQHGARLRAPDRWDIIGELVNDLEMETQARHLLHQRELREPGLQLGDGLGRLGPDGVSQGEGGKHSIPFN